MTAKKNLILIPSASLVSEEMQVEFGKILPIFLPLGNKPVLEHIIESHQNHTEVMDVVTLVTDQASSPYEDALSGSASSRVSFLRIENSRNLGETIKKGLEGVPLEAYSGVYINFGDTIIPGEKYCEKDCIFYWPSSESHRWTVFERSKESIAIVDKRDLGVRDSLSVFTGLFYLNDANSFLEALRDSSSDSEPPDFYLALSNYLKGKDFETKSADKWLDVGHIDTYYDAKRIYTNTRYFNEISIDPARAIIEKRSKYISKFKDEVLWYDKLPPTLRFIAPRIFEYSLDSNAPFVRLEYYGYPPLNDLYLFSKRPLSSWQRIIKTIFWMAGEMQRHELDLTYEERVSACREMFLLKTFRRLEDLSGHRTLFALIEEPLTINGVSRPSVRELLNELETNCESILLSSIPSFTCIHGDLCLSNMLYDSKNGILKLIDPRGSFSKASIYGDPRYDLAKLRHSFSGGYDLIVHDRFTFLQDGDQVTYKLMTNSHQEDIRKMFLCELDATFPEFSAAVKVIEALLFLSMVPLHKDHLQRQLMMLVRGIDLLSAAFDGILYRYDSDKIRPCNNNDGGTIEPVPGRGL